MPSQSVAAVISVVELMDELQMVLLLLCCGFLQSLACHSPHMIPRFNIDRRDDLTEGAKLS